MRSKTWWDYFEDDPFEPIGRMVIGAFGQRIVIRMPRISWAYLDWLAEIEGSDIAQFFIDNDYARTAQDGSIDDWMEGAVRTGFLRREQKGYARPAWLQPAHPAEYMDI